jgi:hypothetical protein
VQGERPECSCCCSCLDYICTAISTGVPVGTPGAKCDMRRVFQLEHFELSRFNNCMREVFQLEHFDELVLCKPLGVVFQLEHRVVMAAPFLGIKVVNN